MPLPPVQDPTKLFLDSTDLFVCIFKVMFQQEELIYGDSGSRKYVGNDVPTGQVATGGSPADIDLSLLSVHDL